MGVICLENSLELKSCTLQETIEAKSAQIKTLDGEAEKYKQGICEIEQKLAIEIGIRVPLS